MSEKKRKPFFSWRQAVLESDLEATTKHVLLTLGCHMNDFGQSCYPSIRRLMLETSLSNRTLIDHIRIATESGWLKKGTRGVGEDGDRQGWKRSEYRMAYPGAVEEGGEPASPPSFIEGGELGSEGGEPDDVNVVSQVHLSTSKSTSGVHQGREPAFSNDPQIVFKHLRQQFKRKFGKTWGQPGKLGHALAEAIDRTSGEAVVKAGEMWIEQCNRSIRDMNWPFAVFMKQLSGLLEEIAEDKEIAEAGDRAERATVTEKIEIPADEDPEYLLHSRFPEKREKGRKMLAEGWTREKAIAEKRAEVRGERRA